MAIVTNYYTETFTQDVFGLVSRTGVDQTFSNIRSGAGNDAPYDGDQAGTVLFASTTTNQYQGLFRAIYLFDTSSIPTDATITGATLSLDARATGKDNGVGSPSLVLVSSNPASTSALVTADYSNLGTTSFGSISYANFLVVGTNSINLNSSGLANITKGGISKFGLRLNWDADNNFTGSWSSSGQSGFYYHGTTPPVTLTVDYAVDFPTLSINNISSLSNVTAITTS